MVNSASQSLAEFKSQRMGGIMSGTSAQIAAPQPGLGNVSAADRMARSAPKRSSTAFMDNVRKNGQRYHSQALGGLQAKQQQAQQQAAIGAVKGAIASFNPRYSLPAAKGKPQTGGPRGAFGLTVPAAAAFGQLNAAYGKAFGGGLTVNSGGRTYAEQAKLYAAYKAGRGNLAAPPGTSLHETGIAIDLGGPIYNKNMAAAVATKQHTWLRQNAAQFKWFWVGQRYGESWHWEYHPEW